MGPLVIGFPLWAFLSGKECLPQCKRLGGQDFAELLGPWRRGAASNFRRRKMRELNGGEVSVVSAGELQCTVGTGGVSCTGTIRDWGDTIFGAYDYAVRGTTDFFCWVGGVK